ncbi:SDR family oxidoreductase [Agrococcus versicolor]
MRIAVFGGTGNAGARIVAQVQRHGHEVVAVSRSGSDVHGAPGAKADLLSGDGLHAALDDVDVLVDATNTANPLDTRIFTLGAQHLIAAAEHVGVERAVVLSIVGAEHSTFPYHQRKADQERRYLSSRLDASVVRATQFHDFPITFFEQARPLGVIPVFLGARFQTVDPDEVAELVAQEAVEPSGKRFTEIGGPRVRVSRDLAKAWQQATHARGLIVNGPFPPSLLTFFREGRNLLGEGGQVGSVSFEDWLSRTMR